ncbi:MAG: hypothetical protein HYV52_00465 [Parcubacteria group bacterium]|nr:hypothetical protein [Parcubacteria group bacterium]
MKFKRSLILAVLILLSFAWSANAATISIIPVSKNVSAGDEFELDIKINTNNVSINAAGVTFGFSKDNLELLNFDKTGSVFNFWLEEPSFSNETGLLKFIGGAAKGISGSSIQILKLKFKAKQNGEAEINFSDITITAADGLGTNVFQKSESAMIFVGITPPSVLPPAALPEILPAVKQPEKIERAPVPAFNLPKAPELKVPLYPDPAKWYNVMSDVIALWDVPSDVIQFAALLDNKEDTAPTKPEKDLFNGKNFGVIKEGIWWIHVRFKNNIGLGETAHFKISLDTTPPAPFEIKIDQTASDNPTPEINYGTQDSLSGIYRYEIFVDNKEAAKPDASATSLKLPVQAPGNHIVLARAVDVAGNSIEDDLEFNILPLPKPAFDFITRRVYRPDAIFVSGKTLPLSFVHIRIYNLNGKEIAREKAGSDGFGNWKMVIDRTLETGKYKLTLQAEDVRGAISYETDPETIQIRPPVILSIGILNLGWFEIILLSIFALISGASAVAYFYILNKQKKGAYSIITIRDVEKFALLLENELKELETRVKDRSDRRVEIEFVVGKIKNIIARMKKYIPEEIKKLK